MKKLIGVLIMVSLPAMATVTQDQINTARQVLIDNGINPTVMHNYSDVAHTSGSVNTWLQNGFTGNGNFFINQGNSRFELGTPNSNDSGVTYWYGPNDSDGRDLINPLADNSNWLFRNQPTQAYIDYDSGVWHTGTGIEGTYNEFQNNRGICETYTPVEGSSWKTECTAWYRPEILVGDGNALEGIKDLLANAISGKANTLRSVTADLAIHKAGAIVAESARAVCDSQSPDQSGNYAVIAGCTKIGDKFRSLNSLVTNTDAQNPVAFYSYTNPNVGVEKDFYFNEDSGNWHTMYNGTFMGSGTPEGFFQNNVTLGNAVFQPKVTVIDDFNASLDDIGDLADTAFVLDTITFGDLYQ